MTAENHFTVNVTSEIGALKALLVHSPDSGLGKVVPSKAQDWLFEDIIHLDTMRREEYDYYIKLLLYFLDADKIKGRLQEIDADESRSFFIPENPGFHRSGRVIEIQNLLADILADTGIREKLTASVCAIENCSYALQERLTGTKPAELAKILISGALNKQDMIFAPIPNLIFSRDIGIAVNNHILLNKPAKKARSRETLLARYIFFNHPLFAAYRDRLIEVPETIRHFLRSGDDPEGRTTIEGGDVMVVSARHVLIGCSERTSVSGANEAMKAMFKNDVVDKVTVIRIPPKRDFMHIDTLFTQVKRNVWVMLGSLSVAGAGIDTDEPVTWFAEKKQKNRVEIIQFYSNGQEPRTFGSLEALLSDISENDLHSPEKTRFIYSGNNTFPFDSREQWTDSCNLLALKEGVVLGYDRNDKTIEAFEQDGFTTVKVKELLQKFENNELQPSDLKDTLILMPSAELSRARGGFHCMSLPLLREEIG